MIKLLYFQFFKIQLAVSLLVPLFIRTMDLKDDEKQQVRVNQGIQISQQDAQINQRAIRIRNCSKQSAACLIGATLIGIATIETILLPSSNQPNSNAISCISFSNQNVQNSCSQAQIPQNCAFLKNAPFLAITPCQHTPDSISTAGQLIAYTQNQFQDVGGTNCVFLLPCSSSDCHNKQNEAINVQLYKNYIEQRCNNSAQNPQHFRNKKLQQIRALTRNHSKRNR
jgi:hypothetical protein